MENKPVSQQIDDIIQMHSGWKSEILSRLRRVILQADPGVIEEIKWKTATRPEGLPVWARDGMLCFAEIWKDNVKLIFSKGTLMADPRNLFNARLNSSAIRAIEFREGDTVNEAALRELVLEAIGINMSKTSKRS